MTYFIGYIGGILFSVVIFILIRFHSKRLSGKNGKNMKSSGDDVPLQDVIKLLKSNDVVGISSLMEEYDIVRKEPEFYERYQAINKDIRETYFQELVRIFGKNRRKRMEELIDNHPEFSTQDRLLLLMCEMGLDNKTMARIMISGLDTLKKRKTRLRVKIREKAPELECYISSEL